MRRFACLALLLLAPVATAQGAAAEFPYGFHWHCPATMDGAHGRLSGALNVEEDGTTRLGFIEWASAQGIRGAGWGPSGVLGLRATWWNSDGAEEPFDDGRLYLTFAAEKTLPETGVFDFGDGSGNGTFVTRFSRNGSDRKSVTADLSLGNLKRWVADDDQVPWRIESRSGRWVTNGVLPAALLSRLEADYARFRAELLARGARPEETCEKVGNTIQDVAT